MITSVRRILIADEDIEMRDLIGTQISAVYASDLVIDQASHGREVLKKINGCAYDLAIVNWALPEISKSELLQEMRKVCDASSLPILVFVSSSDPELVASVLEAGASDVLAKPFERSHLLARVKSFLKNTINADAQGKIVIGDLVLDTRTYDVYCGAERIHLTPSEFKLLQALTEQRGAVMTRDQLIERVQGEGIAVVDRAVDTHIFSLRKKLGRFSDVVQTVRGSGYRIKEL